MVTSAVGLVALGLGLLVEATPEDRSAQPLLVGSDYTVGSRVPFAGDLVVYGTPPDGDRPDLDQLGCSLADGPGPLSTDRALYESRIVVSGRGVVPLVSFPGRPGTTLTCSGPAAVEASPLVVVPGTNARHLVPLAGYSAAALLLPAGLVGALLLVMSRP